MTNTIQLIIVCALRCEAKPFIDFYKLQKQTRYKDFDLYTKNNVTVLVSGIGEQKMHAAIDWFHHNLYLKNSAYHWLNIGIAGHQTATVGELFKVSKISSPNQLDIIPHKLKTTCKTDTIISANDEESTYPHNCLYDMEAYIFFRTVLNFTDLKAIHCFKIVSDNPHQPVQRNKAKISALIANKLSEILSFIDDQITLSR